MSLSAITTPTSKLKTSALIFILITLGLMADQWLQPHGQWLVNIVVWAFFALFLFKTEKADQKKWWICLLLATLGEIVLSDLFGLYSYRENSIPLFVPPGHVLLYASGLWISQLISEKWAWPVLGLALPYAVYCAFTGHDQMSLVLFALWLFMFTQAQLRPLIAVMFVLALVMEILGTGLGNWQWAPTVSFLNFDLTQSNPPFAVGVLYCGLDFLVNLHTTASKPAFS